MSLSYFFAAQRANQQPMENQVIHTDPFRLVRAAVLNGVEPPATAVAALEARGVDVGELTNRLRQQMGMR